MLLKAQQMSDKMEIDGQKNEIQAAKINHDFAGKIGALVSDLHKHKNPQANDR